MKLFIFLFLLLLFAPHSPQLRTRYQPRPALAMVARRWSYVGPRRAVHVTYVRLG